MCQKTCDACPRPLEDVYSGGFPSQQPTPQLQIPAPVQTPYYNTNQDPFSQPAATFAQPAYQQQQQPSQNTLQYPQQQPSTPLLNPFQPFMTQSGVSSAPSLLDPFNLFNLGALNLGQMSPTPSPFAQPQAGFPATPMANQPLQQPTLAQQQPQQGSFFGQPQQLQYEQQRQDNYNNPNVQQPYQSQQQQVPAAQQPLYQNVYSQQNTNYNLQQQQQRNPQPANKQPLPQYRFNQAQPQQTRTQYQVSHYERFEDHCSTTLPVH
ncbi:hypothetical protein TELCIR_16464 [Teladorsagia circumcincta]|uniref:Uncharacterized protein n=1 Tax=Teladorsagia circumcincta TaxID=45464 RepID=A0A2G9TVE4_TELCI|nr:hypothetical protein TELCIR_16464 [Teladorsagia circumcincta]